MRGRWFESLIFINNLKGVGKRIVVDRQKVKASSESSVGGTVLQAG
jgi:hypothetical protein